MWIKVILKKYLDKPESLNIIEKVKPLTGSE